MKVLVTGSTGLVGAALVNALAHENHTVCRLMRPQSVVSGGGKEGFDVAWNPATGELSNWIVDNNGIVTGTAALSWQHGFRMCASMESRRDGRLQ